MLYQLKDATISVGGEEILSHVDFEIKGTEKIAVVGRNGAGKTTLLRVLSGELAVDRDDRRTQPAVYMDRKLTIAKLSQQVFTDQDRTVEEELLAGYRAGGTAYTVNQEDGFQKNLEIKSHVGRQEQTGTDVSAQTGFFEDERERFLYECAYDRLMTGFGFSKEDKNKRISEFSGGQQTKLALIRLLLMEPDVLLLDEPTNHLDMETVEWLERYLRTYKKAVVMVSHDRFFLDRVAEVVYEVTDHRVIRYVGNYTAYRQEKAKANARLQKQYEQQMAERERLTELIERFKHKPKKAAMARAKKKQLERMGVPERVLSEKEIHFKESITPLLPGAKWVYEAEHLRVGYDKPLYETSIRIRRGQKIAVLGANGTGKTALLKTVAGLLPPIKGKSTLGNQILLGYFDQHSAELVSDKMVLEHFRELFPALTEKEARQILASWLFDGKLASRPVSALSGGEKARLVLAELLQSRPNFCVLDEPTNHMDIQAKEVLEEAFAAYTGTLLLVSHDRYLISRVADALLIIQDGEVYYYPFGYAHYLERLEHQQEDVPLAGQMKAEDAALLAGMKAVPKRGNLLGHEQSTGEAYLDWRLRLLGEELEELWNNFEQQMAAHTATGDWIQAEEDLTEKLVLWDVKYQEIMEL
jgi:ATP-binding cassette subfamily F protein 3